MNRTVPLLFLILLTLPLGCSTTRRIPQGEQLYTGIQRIVVVDSLAPNLPAEARSAAESPLEVKPNNALFSTTLRTPFPVGLWVYNNWYPAPKKGFGAWLYGKMVEQPILITDVQPQLRTQVAADALDNYGYFHSRVHYHLIPNKRNPKKAKIAYEIEVAPPYTYDTILFPPPTTPITRTLDSLRHTSLLREGANYNRDTLVAERERIADRLRNEGYCYFRPDFVEYLADTLRTPQRVALAVILKRGLPQEALHPYVLDTVRFTLASPSGKGAWQEEWLADWLQFRYQAPCKINRNVLLQRIMLRPQQRYSLVEQQRTVAALSKLGMFRYLDVQLPPMDSLKGGDSLWIDLQAALKTPWEVEFGVDVSSKSNSYLGPGFNVGVKQNNLFGSGEVLSLQLNGSYEWQTGGSRGEGASLLNSYEFGAKSTLTFPRLFLPRRWQRTTPYRATTDFQLGAELMNRPDYFRLLSLSAAAHYNFQTTPHWTHAITPFQLEYNRLLYTSEKFDTAMLENPSIALSLATSVIPSLRYSATYSKAMPNKNHLYGGFSLMEAGNLLSLLGGKGEKRLLGIPFSQFLRAEGEVRYYFYLQKNRWLATRFLVGAAHAYGNSTVVPYSEQFYIGGANSIRAFTIRSLGPGSYRPPTTVVDGYLDQTGTFKMEANLEYRFPLVGMLQGAVFLDAGNVWLLKDDAQRPGGVLEAKTFWNDIALGTGFGLRIDLTYLVLRGDLGIALHTPYDNPKRHTYYNITSWRDAMAFHLAIGYPF